MGSLIQLSGWPGRGSAQAHQAFVATAAVHNQLGDHRIVVGRDRVAGIEAGIDAHAQAARRVIVGDETRAGHECLGILGVDSALDGVALDHDVVLRETQGSTGGDADLLAHQVDARHRLGDRMLDLQAGVHFDEVELAVLEQELHCAGATILESAHGVGGQFADPVTLLGVQSGRGRFFQHLLMAPLQRAVAFAEMDAGAETVAQHLDLDVARPAEILLDIDRVVVESGLGFGARQREGFGGCLGILHDLHAATAAAGDGLDQDRPADLFAEFDDVLYRLDRTRRSRHQRQPEFQRRLLGHDLVAHHRDMLRRRTDEGETVCLDSFGEARILRQEAVARMDGVGAGDRRGGEDGGNVEVALAGRRRADAHRFVGQPDMHRVAVGGRMDGDGLDAHLAAGAVDTERDLAAVGDEDLVEHRHRGPYSTIISGSPNSTGRAFSIRTCMTVPALGALIGLNVFMASMISRVWPAVTLSPTDTKFGLPGSGAR